VEALLVWDSPTLGNVSPAEFVPLAEEIGLVPALGRFALERACLQARTWSEAGLPALRLSVNVSSVQLRQPGLEAQVQEALRASGLPPERLELEITESALLGDEPEVVETLRAIHASGVRLALDDFGTGYSSLSHLVRFPIDVLKIDRSFVTEIGRGTQGRSIVAAVIAMARRLGLCVVAEGVETEAQAEFLRAEGCDLLQGYHLARPMSGDALGVMLRRSAADRARRAG
jgi:EAL domain-containing protein (putative c-di-GMP-specific phosphodiesterase class I)